MFGNLFGGGNAAASNNSGEANNNGEAANPQGQPGQQVNQSMTNQQQSGNPAGMQTPTQSTPKSGLDMFAELMQNDNSKGSSNQPSSLNIPQDTISKVADSLNFSDSIPPEAMQKLQSGDLSALPEILNSVAKQVYSQAMQHSTGVTDKYLAGRFEQERSFGEQQARVSSVTSNMNISDLPPVAQDMFKNTAKAVAQKYPDLNSKQVEEQVWSMMQDMSDKFNRNKMQQDKQKQTQEVNYDDFGGFGKG